MQTPNPNPAEIYVTFAGPINMEATHRIFQGFPTAVNNGVKRVHLLIHSNGGYVSDGHAIHNYLRNLPIELVTYNCGAVSSIAVLMYLAGKIRKATADATFMIHRTTFSIQSGTAFEMRIRAENAELDDKNTDAILREYIKMPQEKWDIRDRSDLTLSAEEALQYSIVHEIAPFAPSPGARLLTV